MSKLTYTEAAIAMQAGVVLDIQLGSNGATPKHLRVGVNSAMAEHSALAKLLIDKGLISESEYLEAQTEAMRNEVALYERTLSEKLGKPVTLGVDETGHGCVTIEGGQPCCAPTSNIRFAPCALQIGHEGPHKPKVKS